MDINDKDIIEAIDQLTMRFGEITIAFFRLSPFSNAKYEGFGSGFIVTFEGEHFLVSSLHVVEEFYKNNNVFAVINNKNINLSGLVFIANEKEDVAVAYLNEKWVLERNISSLKTYSLNKLSRFTGSFKSDIYFLVGYPSTKNTIHTILKKFNRNLFGFSFGPRLLNYEINDIGTPVAFNLDIKKMHNSKFEKLLPPNLNGTSGSPVFEMMVTKVNEFQLDYKVKLVGIFNRWNKQNKIIVATDSDVIKPLLDILYSQRMKLKGSIQLKD